MASGAWGRSVRSNEGHPSCTQSFISKRPLGCPWGPGPLLARIPRQVRSLLHAHQALFCLGLEPEAVPHSAGETTCLSGHT